MDELLDYKNPLYKSEKELSPVKVKDLIKSVTKYGGSRSDVAKSAGITEQMLNNLVSQGREVLQLANGDYILTSKHTKIFNSNHFNG